MSHYVQCARLINKLSTPVYNLHHSACTSNTPQILDTLNTKYTLIKPKLLQHKLLFLHKTNTNDSINLEHLS